MAQPPRRPDQGALTTELPPESPLQCLVGPKDSRGFTEALRESTALIQGMHGKSQTRRDFQRVPVRGIEEGMGSGFVRGCHQRDNARLHVQTLLVTISSQPGLGHLLNSLNLSLQTT